MKRWLFAASCVLFAAGFASLAGWQVERRTWKLALIARIDARIHAAPAPLPPRGLWRADHAYRRIRVSGRFLHASETMVQALTVHGPGWWVLTPLVTGGTTVLVNRGFVPADRRSPASRAAGQIAGPITVTGLLRASEPGGGFLRSNDPASDHWYSRDVAAIARARGIADTPPFFLDADATANPGGLPIGGLTVVSFPNNHLVHALTWLALALLSLTGAVMALRHRGRP